MDDFDVAIIRFIIREKHATTSDLAKGLLSPKDRFALRSADSKLQYRLRRLLKQGVVSKDGRQYKLSESVRVMPEAHLADRDHHWEAILPNVAVVTTATGFYLVTY